MKQITHFFKPMLWLLACAFSLSLSAQSGENRRFKINKNLDYFNLIFKDVDLFYVDSIDAEKTIQTGIRAMLRSLDPYTVFYPQEEREDFKTTFITRKYSGIGATITLNKNGEVIIAEPYEGMPAAEYGLKAGDVLLEIDGEPLKELGTEAVSERLRGKGGSALTVKVRRSGTAQPIEIKLVRGSIHMPSVLYYGIYGDKTGYIYLENFTGNPAKEFKQALMALKKEGITSLIIDLRDNGGGSLEEAVTIANYFLPKGKEIVSIRGKNKRLEQSYKTTSMPIDSEIPLAVLVNEGSASSSEILAGAFQDLDRAVIIGARTYGKGLVQMPRPLPYGATLKLTTAKYYTPSGRCIQAINYSARHEGGEGDMIPDSLTQVFHTAAGREVRDGRGITPDITLKRPDLSSLIFALELDTLRNIFDYATEYALTHPTIPTPEQFTLTNEEYETFKKQLINSGFTYDLRSERILKQLKEFIKREGYEEVTAEAIAALEQSLSHDLNRDLDFFSKEIRELIEMEIAKRYYYQKGAIRVILKNDEELKRALETLQSPEAYHRILSPQSGDATSEN